MVNDLAENGAKEKRPHGYQRGSKLLLGTILLGLLANECFVDQAFGISVPLFVLAFYGVFFWNLGSTALVQKNFAGGLMIPILLLTLTYVLFSNEVFQVLNVLAISTLIVMQTTLSAKRARADWYAPSFVIDVLIGFIYRPFAFLAVPFKIAAEQIGRRTAGGKNKTLTNVFIGIVLTFPLVVIILMLLSSADERFNYYLGAFPHWLAGFNLDTLMPRLIFISAVALFSFSYIWSLMMKPKQPARYTDSTEQTTFAGCMDATVVTTILSIINAIYVFFTLIQFSYLFGSFSLGLPQQFTYAEYARRGFFELVLVTLINFTLLLVLLHLTKQSSGRVNRAIQILESLLVCCTMVMLVSAFIRMYLYEQMYGFTYLRVLTHAFMILLFVLFLVTLFRIWKKGIKLFKYYLLAGITAFVVINYANIDVLIARWNIDRYSQTGKIDVAYLATLSNDATPYLVQLLKAKDDAVRKVAENRLFEQKQILNQPQAWQSFNLSNLRAKQLLDQEQLQRNQLDPSLSHEIYDD
ncbi:DUF4153 domain-containing protein [Sporolactobacillus terrae]|uniref:DUF4153 domain-containing protein n=1 Tax=Sporolactobacillus terrae TaxID=269673 RepID=UPI000ACD7737|nr:DUF4173 domain-containing protein [Sporolactobacillus terrae]